MELQNFNNTLNLKKKVKKIHLQIDFWMKTFNYIKKLPIKLEKVAPIPLTSYGNN